MVLYEAFDPRLQVLKHAVPVKVALLWLDTGRRRRREGGNKRSGVSMDFCGGYEPEEELRGKDEHGY